MPTQGQDTSRVTKGEGRKSIDRSRIMADSLKKRGEKRLHKYRRG